MKTNKEIIDDVWIANILFYDPDKLDRTKINTLSYIEKIKSDLKLDIEDELKSVREEMLDFIPFDLVKLNQEELEYYKNKGLSLIHSQEQELYIVYNKEKTKGLLYQGTIKDE